MSHFGGITVIGWQWKPRYWMFRGWGPWSQAASYAFAFGPLFVERYFYQGVEDGGGIPAPKLVISKRGWRWTR